MPPESGETRTHYQPRTGTKVSLLIGLALLLAAVYAAVMPLGVASKSGPNFGCGSAISPNNDAFAKGYCNDVDRGAQIRAIALGAGGILLAGAGAGLFGFDTTIRTRKGRPGFDDGYEDENVALPRGTRDSDRPARKSKKAKQAPRRELAEEATDRGDADLDLGDQDNRDDKGRGDDGQRDGRDDGSPDGGTRDDGVVARAGRGRRRPLSERVAQRTGRPVDFDEDEDLDDDDETDVPLKRR